MKEGERFPVGKRVGEFGIAAPADFSLSSFAFCWQIRVFAALAPI
jgi:hypothetical protein